MTEIERMLTDTLATLEKELHQEQEAQKKRLAAQQGSLATHETILQSLQQQIAQLSVQQQKSIQHLQLLSSIHKKLEPLLERLNCMLNARAHS